MTTTNVEVAQSVPPGTIIFVRPTIGLWNPGSLDEGVFGFPCSLDYWNRKASERAKKLFIERSSEHSEQVPVLTLDGNFDWELRFVEKNRIVEHGSIFLPWKSFWKFHSIFESFTIRDGSKYYERFLDKTKNIYEVLLADEEDKGRGIVKYRCPGIVDFMNSLIKYKREQGLLLSYQKVDS